MKLHRFLMPLAAVLLLLTSCGKRLELLETIPADVVSAMSVNVNKLMDELQIKADSSGVIIPPQLQNAWGAKADRLRVLARAGRAVDLEHVFMVFQKKNETPYVTFAVTDADAFDAAMKAEGCERTDVGGYAVYAVNGFSVAVADGNGWFVAEDGEGTVKTIKGLLKRASDRSLAEVEGVASRLSGDALTYVAFNSGSFSPVKDGGQWGVSTVNVKDNAITGDIVAINADGSPVATKGMKRINTPVLQYAPDNASLVAACGISKDADWDSVVSAINATGALNAAQQAQMQMVLPYLKALDGTVMVAFGPAQGLSGEEAVRSGFDGYDFIAMMHMDQQTVDQGVAAATSLASQMGTVSKVAEGLYSFPVANRTFYIGNVDGYLTFSSFRPADTNGSSIAARFTGKEGGLSLRLPSLAVFDPERDYGIDFIMTGGGSKATYTLNLIGTDAPILLTLLQ